jgi:hypothetical protein
MNNSRLTITIVNMVVVAIIKTATLCKGKVNEKIELICAIKHEKMGIVKFVAVPSPELSPKVIQRFNRIKPGKVFSAEVSIHTFTHYGPIRIHKMHLIIKRAIFTRRPKKAMREFIQTL